MLEIGSIVWGVKDIPRAVKFWSEALDYSLKYPTDVDWAMLGPNSGEGLQLSLKLVTSDKARRHHMDLFADDRDAEVKRLLSIGATEVDWNYEEGADYRVLADPDGNRFCVVQI